MLLPVLSRVATLVISIISDSLVVDHNAEGVESFDFEYSSQFAKLLSGAFLRWDSVHMLKIAAEGYHHEHQLVFFPLFPASVSIIASSITSVGITHHERILVAALLLNFVAFVLAYYILKRLLRQLLHGIDKRTISLAMLMFCFNPAGVFFSMPYTESVFACLSWSGFLLYAQGHDILSILPLCLASFVRSNGSLNVIVIALMWLGRRHTTAKETEMSALGDASTLLLVSSILTPALLLNQVHLHILCAESLVCATCLCPVDVSNLLPTLSSWFLHSAQLTAGAALSPSPLLRISTDAQTIALCNAHSASALPPVVYSYLQEKYWHVGLLRQYQWRQLPNFMLALPMWCVVLYTLYHAGQIFSFSVSDAGGSDSNGCPIGNTVANGDGNSDGNNSPNNNKPGVSRGKKSKKSKRKHAATATTDAAVSTTTKNVAQNNTSVVVNLYNAYDKWIVRPETPFVVHLFVLLVIGMFYAHVQMITRLVCAASPIIYVGMAHIAQRRDYKCYIDVHVYTGRVSWVVVYLVVYNVLGVILHCNYYPWT